ncbi:MAG: site-specific integrase, partial [Pseudomonas sp.]
GQAVSRPAQRTSLTPRQLVDAEAAIQQCNGESLANIVAHYMGLTDRCVAKGADLNQAIRFFEAQYRPEFTSITLMNGIEEFLRTRKGITDSTRENYENGLRLLLKTDPNRPVHSFSVGDLEQSLSKYDNLRTLKSFRRIYSVFFGWALRHHYCLENPCVRFDKLPNDLGEVVILKFTAVERLLFAAMKYQGGVSVAAVAIGLFAGLRPSELADLRPEDIGANGIRVVGGKLRRKLKRTVPISENLAEWLKEYPFKELPDAWDYKMKVLKRATDAARWVQDIIRHTSLSYQAERDKNEALTAYNCGTSPKMMDVHYKDSIDNPGLVREFWKLTPSRISGLDLQVGLPDRKTIAWPAKATLSKLVWAKSLVNAAAEIGVSDVALRKRCLALGVSLPPHGHWIKRPRRGNAA